MSSLTLKIIFGTFALATAGTATYFVGRELFRSSTIKEKLISENFKFIGANAPEQWKEEFDSDQATIKLALGISISDGASLKGWCDSKLNISSDNEEDLKNVKKWCGIRNIASQLKRKQKKLLVGLNDDAVAQKWTDTIDKRRTTSADRKKLNLEGSWGSNVTSETEKVKKWCELKSNEDYLVNEETYKLVEAWCTEEGKNIQTIQ